MKRVKTIFIAVLMVLLMTAAAYADSGITTEQLCTQTYLERGITVLPNGNIYVINTPNGGSTSYLKGYTSAGASTGFSAKLPSAYCGNLCSAPDGTIFTHFSKTENNIVNHYIVVFPSGSASYKTLPAGVACDALATDSNGYLYNINNSGTSTTAVIYRVKVSDVLALSGGTKVSWEKTYEPNYTPPTSTKCYPRALAVDNQGNAYIVDQGSYNGHDASVSGIYKYNLNTGKLTTLHFSADNTALFKWAHGVTVDDYGNVCVLGRNSYLIAVFRSGSTVADEMISVPGFADDLASDSEGNLYYSVANKENGIFKATLNNVSVTGLAISPDSKEIKQGESFDITATVAPQNASNKNVIYTSSNTGVATVSETGTVKGVSAGSAVITVKTAQGNQEKTCAVTVTKPADTSGGSGSSGSSGTSGSSGSSVSGKTGLTATGTVINPIYAKGKTVKIKYSKLKKKNQVIKFKNAYTIKNAKGKKSFKKVSVSKKKYAKKFVVNASTGKITVKKGVKKGTYKIRIKVTAAGNSTYKKGSKTVTVTVKVK